MDAKDKRIAELEALLKAALERIATLEARIAMLEKNSRNSSKPPSSDIVSTPKNKDGKKIPKTKRKSRAQNRHKQHLRESFSEQQVDKSLHSKSMPVRLVAANSLQQISHQKSINKLNLLASLLLSRNIDKTGFGVNIASAITPPNCLTK
jgi:hypothetical protein